MKPSHTWLKVGYLIPEIQGALMAIHQVSNEIQRLRCVTNFDYNLDKAYRDKYTKYQQFGDEMQYILHRQMVEIKTANGIIQKIYLVTLKD